MSHPAIYALIDALRSHPDYDGGLETQDMPHELVEAVYDALGKHGDDLTAIFPGARGWSDAKGKNKLVVVAPSQNSGWNVKYATDSDVEVDWGMETPDSLADLIREVIGGNAHRQRAFRKVLEEVWETERAKIENENAALGDGWKTIPNRDSDTILAEALQRFMK